MKENNENQSLQNLIEAGKKINTEAIIKERKMKVGWVPKKVGSAQYFHGTRKVKENDKLMQEAYVYDIQIQQG